MPTAAWRAPPLTAAPPTGALRRRSDRNPPDVAQAAAARASRSAQAPRDPAADPAAIRSISPARRTGASWPSAAMIASVSALPKPPAMIPVRMVSIVAVSPNSASRPSICPASLGSLRSVSRQPCFGQRPTMCSARSCASRQSAARRSGSPAAQRRTRSPSLPSLGRDYRPARS